VLSQAVVLALGASVYPPAVAAVIAFGHGEQVRTRVVAFVLAAWLVTYAVGVLLLFVLIDLGVGARDAPSVGPAVQLVVGVLLLGVAVELNRRRATARPSNAPSKLERYLQSTRLAFVLGITLYVVPSPIYIGAVASLTDADDSATRELILLGAVVVVMLWMVELPMLALLVIPARALDTLEGLNRWFGHHGRRIAVIAAAAAGAYLAIQGFVDLVG